MATKKDNFIIRSVKNMFFPGVPSMGGPDVNMTGNIVPIRANNAKRLDWYRAPISLNRIKVDIGFWRQSIVEAENPSLPFRVKMQQMFQDTRQNGHVYACMQKRKNLVLLKEYQLVDDKGNIDEKASEVINNHWFRLALEYILEARFYGYSLLTFGDLKLGDLPDLTIVPRWRIRPDNATLSTQQYLPTGIEFMKPEQKDPRGISYYDWSLWVPTPSEDGQSPVGYGLLYKVALYEIILRNIIGWNSDFIEVFGQPLIHAEAMDTNNEDEMGTLENMLDSMGVRYAITDQNQKITLLGTEGSSGTGWQGYENLEHRACQFISKILLGHPDAIDQPPSKLGGGSASKQSSGIGTSPAQIAIDEVEASDSRWACSVINDFLLPKLINIGVPIPLGRKFAFKDDLEKLQIRMNENKNNLDDANVQVAIAQAGGKPDWVKFNERTGMNIVAEDVPIPPKFSPQVTDKLNKLYK